MYTTRSYKQEYSLAGNKFHDLELKMNNLKISIENSLNKPIKQFSLVDLKLFSLTTDLDQLLKKIQKEKDINNESIISAYKQEFDKIEYQSTHPEKKLARAKRATGEKHKKQAALVKPLPSSFQRIQKTSSSDQKINPGISEYLLKITHIQTQLKEIKIEDCAIREKIEHYLRKLKDLKKDLQTGEASLLTDISLENYKLRNALLLLKIKGFIDSIPLENTYTAPRLTR